MIRIGQNPARMAMDSFLHTIAPDANASGARAYLRGERRGIRTRFHALTHATPAEQQDAFRTKETLLAGYGVRWDEAEVDHILARELREHRAARIAARPDRLQTGQGRR